VSFFFASLGGEVIISKKPRRWALMIRISVSEKPPPYSSMTSFFNSSNASLQLYINIRCFGIIPQIYGNEGGSGRRVKLPHMASIDPKFDVGLT
jgi:hypothetical protein